MAIVVGTNSYGTAVGLEAYAIDRGITISSVTDQLLLKAMDWLEIQVYKSRKYEETQALQFPRANLLSYGDVYGVVPTNVITAQYVAALIINSGTDLLTVVDRKVKRQKVDVIEIEYADDSKDVSYYPQLEMLLRDYLVGNSPLRKVVR